VGQTPYRCLGRQTEQQNNKNKKCCGLKWLSINISNTTTNQKHVGMMEEKR
jgi:hypothetical protein